MKRVSPQWRLASRNTRSCSALVIPITLTGLHALSVEIPTTVSTGRRRSRIARTMFSAPITFVRTASTGWYSQVGTCFIAAAWKTTSASRRTAATESGSRTSPMRKTSRWRRSSS